MGSTSEGTFKGLIDDIKKYLLLKKEFYYLDVLEKCSLFLGYMILLIAVLLLGCFALLTLSFAIAYILGDILGSFIGGFLIITAFYIVLIIILFVFKKQILINPIVRVLNKTLFKKIDK